jgi:competence protein ComEA
MNAARLFIGGALMAVFLVVAAVVWVDRATPVTVVVNALPEEDLRVSIHGAVATPGVVLVPAGARLDDVARAAGGFTDEADFTSLNLAGRVGDGESITIPAKGEQQATPSPGISVETGAQSPLVNINTATVQELEKLPGIGEVLAGRIVEYRETNGVFQSVDELSNVDGISGRMVEMLSPLVTLGDGG